MGSYASTPAGPRGVFTVDWAVLVVARFGDIGCAAYETAVVGLGNDAPAEGACAAAACLRAASPSAFAEGRQLTVDRASTTATNFVVGEIGALRTVLVAFEARKGLTETVPGAAIAAFGACRPTAPVSWQAIDTARGNGTVACLRTEGDAFVRGRGHGTSTSLVALHTV